MPENELGVHAVAVSEHLPAFAGGDHVCYYPHALFFHTEGGNVFKPDGLHSPNHRLKQASAPATEACLGAGFELYGIKAEHIHYHFQGAGVAKRMDEGFVELSKPGSAKDFIARCAKLRFWDREAVKKD